MADDFLTGAACCSSVEKPGIVIFQARSDIHNYIIEH